MLFKTKLSMLVLFSAFMAYLIVASQILWHEVLLLMIGGFMVTAASNILNQVLERDFDKLMKRTADRPLATGRMSISTGVMMAGFLALIGTTLLAVLNVWAALLGMLSLVSYSFIYTPMKRVSPIAVWIGAIPGALPMAIGCVVAEGTLTPLAIALFGIQFFWQFPHFWAIGFLGFEDYKKAGFKFLPGVNGQRDEKTGLHSFIYAMLLVFVPFLFWWNGDASIISVLAIAITSLVYAKYGWNLYKENTDAAAKKLMFFSFAYMPIVLFVLMVEKFL